MFSVWSIVSANNATFYEYNTNHKISIRPRLFVEVAISATVAIILDKEFKDFLNGVITVQAILIGFSFSVMFFLMSAAGVRASRVLAEPMSLEAQLREEKLENLSREIFHNVAYFNLVAMACLAIALVILLPNGSDVIWIFLKTLKVDWFNHISRPYGAVLAVVEPGVRAAFLFLLIESAYSFARTTGRVNYLFGKRLEI